ncbi:MAG: hypothetical protein IJZ44_08400 [Lachnospiraceae bacterium]|nr:hypothetical protein [Lachnospiraceae bacterium]MBQ8232858.1 hypothetical protein [Lachnospiraceae bacterium]
MGNLTYQNKDGKNKLENFEWDSTWIDYANDNTHKRVLYIGDSISKTTRDLAEEIMHGEVYFDRFGTSKGIDNPYFKDSISLFAKQLPKVDVILFNNGLHGWHLSDDDEYAFYYENMIKYLLDSYKNSPLYIVLSTHVKNPERANRVMKRNESAKMIANKYSLPVIDLYSLSKENENFLTSDGVHFLEEGYKIFALEITDILYRDIVG